MSAFLYYSQTRRKTVQGEHPEMKNTEVSRHLGEMWRNASDEEKKPYIEKEIEEREKYKVATAKWKKENEAQMEERRKQEAEFAARWKDYPYPPPAEGMEYPPHRHYPPPPTHYVHPSQYGYPPYGYNRKYQRRLCRL